ncbi:MAG: hypothetical protein RQ856_01875 [Candidatus Izemoplasmatales bacterium]|nr:hypothetical protein [Candidatus Izemoplasmatales bacterium]
MNKQSRHETWFKLDNSGKIFPEVSSHRETNVFRVAISLTEKIDGVLLQQSVDTILTRYPMFKVKLKKGLFWSYFDYNSKPFHVEELKHYVCGEINPKKNNGYLFRVMYRNTDIIIEMFHSLADGAGVIMLLKALTYEYLVLVGKDIKPDNLVPTKNQRPSMEEYEDANTKFYDPKNKKHVPEKRAYRIKGTPLSKDLTGIISGTMSTSRMIRLARENEMTITEYFTALMMYIIYVTQIQYRGQIKSNQSPVKIFVPVNLRKHFPSNTLRNFSNFVKVGMVMTEDDISFDDLKIIVKEQFEKGMTKSELIRKMSENVKFEKNVFLRFTPYFLKKYALKIGYNILGMKLNTMSLTNIGKVDFPVSMQPFVYDVTAGVYSGKFNTVNCSIMSYQDRLKLSFTRSIVETTIEREFFRHFTDLGIDVEIESNYVEEY